MKRRSRKAGLPPGTPVYLGSVDHETQVSVFRYNEDNWKEEVWPRDGSVPCPEVGTVLWVDLKGVHDTALLETFRETFAIHPLVLEDIVNTDQRPKVEDHGDYLYLVAKMLLPRRGNGVWQDEQISIILGENFVLTFQERPGDVFNSLRDRIRSDASRVRNMDAGYLMYTLVDLIVDHYFAVLEELGEELDELQERILAKPDQDSLIEIQGLRRQLLLTRKAIWPMRELASRLERQESALLAKVPGIYLRDVYDHTIHCIDTLEAFREVGASILEIYLSGVSNRTNDVMKVLTIISTIFLPLTFIAGVYGMNFILMPELELTWGYPAILVLMAGIAGGMVIYFRRKGWL